MRIEGYFDSVKTANMAVERLKRSGFTGVSVDLNDANNRSRNIQTDLSGTGQASSLSGLVLGETTANRMSVNSSPLSAASPMVSGMGTFNEIAGVRCKVIADAEEGESGGIQQIIREMGGDLK
jgi:hypothetical protein